MTNTNGPEYLTLTEAAKISGRSRTTITRWIKEGQLTEYRVGPGRGFPRIMASELDTLLTPKPVTS